jgi:Zn-dependent protease
LTLEEETPQSVLPSGGVVYKVNSSRASFGELWRDNRSPLVLIGWITKLMRVRLPGSVNDPNVESLRPFEVSANSFPEDVRSRIDPMLKELGAVGFDIADPIYHFINDLFNHSRSYIVSVWRLDGRAIGRMFLRMEGSNNPPKTHAYCDLLSEVGGGGFLWTTSAKAVLDAPAGLAVKQHIGFSPSQLWAEHEKRLVTMGGDRAIVPAADRAAAIELIARHHARIRDFHLRRGVFDPMSESEQRSSDSLQASYSQASAEGFAYPEVMAELERIQNKRTSWVSGLIVLVISVALFIGIGLPGVDQGPATGGTRAWELLLLVVPILFLHEMGHFLAMKVFGYRNVRMFFIPLFGAAVSGQNYTAPGWKKAIVALMGPLPGIAIGSVIGIAGIVAHKALWMKLGLLMLILNGFQLLPLLPLDGGRVMQTLLFSRHFGMDVAFRVVAGLAILALGLLPHNWIFMVVGVAMLMSIPTVWKLGKIAMDLRRQWAPPLSPPPMLSPYGMPMFPPPQMAPVPPSAPAMPYPLPYSPVLARPDQQTIPPDVARVIIERVRAAFPKGIASQTRLTAQNTLNVYEMLCARPPGWGATLGFLVLNFGGLLVALILAVLLFAAQQGGLRSFIAAASRQPRNSITAADIVTASGPAAATTSSADAARGGGRGTTVVLANFANLKEATSVFESARGRLGPGESIERFGQTLMVSLPSEDRAARKRWIAELEARTKDVCVTRSSRGGGRGNNDDAVASIVPLTLTCLAPDAAEAQKLVQDVSDYLSAPSFLHLMAPWSPEFAALPSAEREGYRLARRTYSRVSVVEYEIYRDPQVTALSKQMVQSRRHGDGDEVKRLLAEQQVLQRQLRLERIRELAETKDGSVDPIVIEKYQQAFPPSPATRATTDRAQADEDDDESGLAAEMARQRLGLKNPAFRALADRMGHVELIETADGSMPAPGADRTSAYGSLVTHEGPLMTFQWLNFRHAPDGAPALIRWLADKNCTMMKYSFRVPESSGADQGEN